MSVAWLQLCVGQQGKADMADIAERLANDFWNVPEPAPAEPRCVCLDKDESGSYIIKSKNLCPVHRPAEPVVTELVSDLRMVAKNDCCLCAQAADAITRLEAEKARLEQATATGWALVLGKAEATIARLEAEKECRDEIIRASALAIAEAQATIARHEQTIREINEAWGRDAAEVNRLEDERDRLRKALELVMLNPSRCAEHARAALDGEK
jgi:hypothetical protein